MRFSTCVPGRIPNNTNVLVFSFENSKQPVGAYLYGDSVQKSFLEAKDDGFIGSKEQVVVVRPKDGRFIRFFFIGLGLESESSLDSLRRATAVAFRKATSLNVTMLHVKPPQNLGNPEQLAQALSEGATLGLYRYTDFQSSPKSNGKIEALFYIAKDEEEENLAQVGLKRGVQIGSAVCYARDLINRPPSDTTPEFLVKEAKQLVGKGISLRVFNKAQIEKMGMGALLGVNRGSHQPPFFLHLTYKSSNKPKRKIGICGKGITFDSGGLSLKPAASMETMKYDMSGAASVFAIFRALSLIEPKSVEVHGFTPLTENMPGGNALKPGDVLKTMRGKTIEVLNSDAEGRLVLADALSYASQQNLDEVLDIATLTGACVIALGNQIAAIMGSDPKLVDRIKKAASDCGEKVWELPLEKEYRALIKSPVADLKNIGPVGQAGTIIAGLFLKEFVDSNLPWAHLDIASTGWASAQTPLSETGATGVMIRTLIHHILSYN